jgi:acyl phosphate:glycerol-3-phosphate acyltransferase
LDFVLPNNWQLLALACEVSLVLGYLLGSIPFGLIITWAVGLGDVRKLGSGNIGATNVLRAGNKPAAVLTLLCDAGKGATAVLVGHFLGGDVAAAIAALAAFLGHLYPVWLDFKGGKGVATFLGVTLALSWPVGLMTCLTWLGAALLWRTSSLAALIAAAATPIYLAFWQQYLFAALLLLLTVLIFMTHEENILRLIKGQEPKIGGAKGTA